MAVVVTAAFAQGWKRGSYEMIGIRGSGGRSGHAVRDCASGDGMFAWWWVVVGASSCGDGDWTDAFHSVAEGFRLGQPRSSTFSSAISTLSSAIRVQSDFKCFPLLDKFKMLVSSDCN